MKEPVRGRGEGKKKKKKKKKNRSGHRPLGAFHKEGGGGDLDFSGGEEV